MISVITPVFNTEKYLPQCVESVLSQSFSDFELLLIDDGSTDGSGAICDKYAEKDNRVRVFHKENGGVSSARNLGIGNARSEWLYFADSDDELFPNCLQTLVDCICDEIDLVVAGYNTYNENGLVSFTMEKKVSRILSREDTLKEMFEPSDCWYQGYLWNKMFRVSVIRRNNICFAENIYFNEDRLFVIRFLCAMGNSVFYTTIPVYKYFERKEGAMMLLKKGFNPKFVTDFEAQVMMRESVRSRFLDGELRELADYEVYRSFRRIVGMMDEFQVDDKSLLHQLRSKLISTIGRGKYIKYEIHRDKRRVRNKLKKILRYG